MTEYERALKLNEDLAMMIRRLIRRVELHVGDHDPVVEQAKALLLKHGLEGSRG